MRGPGASSIRAAAVPAAVLLGALLVGGCGTAGTITEVHGQGAAGVTTAPSKASTSSTDSKRGGGSATSRSTVESASGGGLGGPRTTVGSSGGGSGRAHDPACPPVDGSATPTREFAKAPPMCIDPARTYRAVVDTTEGEFTIALDAEHAPRTVNNFVVLARYHFYDGIVFHRVIPGFMAQGGDPEGTGRGGPGYEFADELPNGDAPYTRGAVAMANAGPNTNGSQFFVMAADNLELPPDYSVFGHVTVGLDTTIDAIMEGPSAGEPPDEPSEIRSISITES